MLPLLYFVFYYIFFNNFEVGYGRYYEQFRTDCTIDTRLPKFPLVIRKSTPYVLLPRDSEVRYLEFRIPAEVEFFCPGNSIVIAGNDIGVPIIDATCSNTAHTNFMSRELRCAGAAIPTIYNRNLNCGGGNYTYYALSFTISRYRFIKIYATCFDSINLLPIYTYHHFLPIRRLQEQILNIPQDPLPTDDIFRPTVDLASIIAISSQKEKINKLLSLEADSDQYISSDNHLVFTYLTPNHDFFYDAFRNSTKTIANLVPQWKSIRTGNWKKIEDQVRELSVTKRRAVQIWTGVHGKLELTDVNGEMIAIYLMGDERKMLVPKFFWKVIYSRTTSEGIVLITLNNPYLEQKSIPEFMLCEDVTNGTGWLNWNEKYDIKSGYSYGCNLNHFRKFIKYFLDLGVVSVLSWEERGFMDRW